MTEPTEYGPNEDEEYINIVWGILRYPIQCRDCHTMTRLACFIADAGLGPFCGRCHRVRMEAMAHD
jgi:hypothetical protein